MNMVIMKMDYHHYKIASKYNNLKMKEIFPILKFNYKILNIIYLCETQIKL